MRREKLIVVNPSRDDEYHSQINNKEVPHGACNVTAYVMSGKQAGRTFTHPPGVQPEDHMMRHLRTPKAWERLERDYRWAFSANGEALYPPNEVHGMLVWAFNDLIGEPVARFTTRGSIQEMAYHIVQGNGVVLSGVFCLPNGRHLNHIVSLAGIKTAQLDIRRICCPDDVDSASLRGMIIDDPYGNPHAGYRDRRGNNINLSMAEFDSIMKSAGSPEKWMHVITRAA